MRLADWRREQGLNQQELADLLGCEQAYISKIERAVDPQIPGRAYMARIYRATSGAVTPNDFYDLPDLDGPELPLEAAPAPLLAQMQEAA